jgi:hypothetical protein
VTGAGVAAKAGAAIAGGQTGKRTVGMLKLLFGIAVIGGVLWYQGYWPFDGSTKLPKREPTPKP